MMNKELMNWLNENADITVSAGGWSWYIDEEGRVAFAATCDLPYVSVNVDGASVYTDAMEYGLHGYGDGSGEVDILLDALPRAIRRATERWYGAERHGWRYTASDLASDLDAYILARNGWTPNLSYFDCIGDQDELAREAIEALGIPHNEAADEDADEE